jgi:hypothetical protein
MDLSAFAAKPCSIVVAFSVRQHGMVNFNAWPKLPPSVWRSVVPFCSAAAGSNYFALDMA